MQKAVEAGDYLDESTKIDDPRNRAQIRFTDLRLRRQRLDTGDRGLSCLRSSSDSPACG